MSKLRRQKAKERFLSMVDIVDKEVVLEELKNNTEGENLYTYFIKKNAFKSGALDESEVNEFLLKVYSDWYFLHKNTKHNNVSAVKLLSELEYAPVSLSGRACLNLIKSGKYNSILPISLQYVNKLEDQYFMAIKIDDLYNRNFGEVKYDARLYLNLPYSSLIEFAKEFLDKAYIEEFPAILKVLNNDNRCDTIIIYTDYEYVEKIVEVIKQIKNDTPRVFATIGPVSSLLGSIDDYIGFGEISRTNTTYFASRCRALSSMQNKAGLELLNKGLVAEEKKIIFRKENESYTASEYLEFLIERNIVKIVENKIDEIEKTGVQNSPELDKLYDMRDNVKGAIDLNAEVNKLKRAITRNIDYRLELEGIGSDDYDYISKLYRLFTSVDTRNLKTHSVAQKKDIIGNQVFKLTETFEGVDTREFLDTYFKAKLSLVLKDLLDSDIEMAKRSRQSAVLVNIKKKSCARLKSILTSVIDDGDEGKEYIGRCINDYIRILTTGALENVEVTVDGRVVTLDTDINVDIVNMLPALKEEVDKLSVSGEFIDNILLEFGINKDNICLNRESKNISRKKEKQQNVTSDKYYYNPDGYLSK